jgi:Flp pilus assembly pilin Flp
MRYFLALDSWFESLREDDGQTMAEYAVILGVIAVGVIVAITALSGGISSAIDRVADVLP